MASLPSKFAGGSAAVDDSAAPNHPDTIDATYDGSWGVENDSKSENRGPKRKAYFDTAESKKSSKDTRPCMFVELPEEVLAIALSFQTHRDHLMVAITCKDSLKKVETLSERKWKEIQLKADDTWEARIRDQSFINTENPRPRVLPHRYLLWKACRTHLYSLGEMNPSEVVSLDAMPDKRLMISERDVCQTWDLATKRCVKRFDFFPRQQTQEEVYKVLVRGEHVVAELDASVLVWTSDGELLHRADEPEVYIEALDADEQKVFFGNASNSISCLDITTGSVERGVVTWQGRLLAISLRMLVLSENLLLVLIRGGEEAGVGHSFDANGIYVFDIEGGYSQKHVYPGNYYSIVKASDDPSTIVASRLRHVDVFKLENGCLSRSTTFSILSSRIVLNATRILLAARLRIYIRNSHTDRVEEYNGLNGELLRTFGELASDVTCMAASTSGCELFLGFSEADGDAGGPSVRAYCLDGN